MLWNIYNNFRKILFHNYSIMIISSTNFARPADVLAYSANDCVSNSVTVPTVLVFATLQSNDGVITKVKIVTNNVTGMTARFRLHLFSAVPAAIVDNNPYTQMFANASILIDSIDLPAMKTEGTGSDCSYAINKDILVSYAGCKNATIYGLLETLDAFTPASGQLFQLELTTATNA
jgi:hypothetical protein